MKTTASIPDGLFERVERFRQRRGKSRSEVYTSALSDYLNRHSADVTEAMNRVVDSLEEARNPAIVEAAGRILERVEW
jgi:metal-responsive CopG/Arc/MetJ family transcriptional regulator